MKAVVLTDMKYFKVVPCMKEFKIIGSALQL
jgi:hypothetical protein